MSELSSDEKFSLKWYEKFLEGFNGKNIDDPTLLGWLDNHDHLSHAKMTVAVINKDCESVLDLGSGFGHSTKLMSELLPKAVFHGVELNPVFHDHAIKTYGSERMKFYNESFFAHLERTPVHYYDWIVGIGSPFEFVKSDQEKMRLFLLIASRSKRGFSSTFCMRRPWAPSEQWWNSRFEDLKKLYPNAVCKYNFKISEARKLGVEGKISLTPYYKIVYFDKGVDAEPYRWEIPKHEEPLPIVEGFKLF